MSTPHRHIQDIHTQRSSRLLLSLVITLGFVFFEAISGIFANSLALLTDAAHNLTDVIALALSWHAIRLALRPANAQRTYGYHRAGILIAFVNAASLGGVAILVGIEAFHRFQQPLMVKSELMTITSGLAFVINLVTAWIIKKDSHADLNLRSAYVHLMGDVLSTLGAFAAGIAIIFTGFNWLDPLTSLLIVLIILWNAWKILKESSVILLEGTPSDIELSSLVQSIKDIPGVLDVHDLHVWSITNEMRSLSVHIVTEDMPLSHAAVLQNQIQDMLEGQFHIYHATIQLESQSCDPAYLYCNLTMK
ncbi:MAG: cation diffusion facilitator family transporter [Chloroflexota bacterium]